MLTVPVGQEIADSMQSVRHLEIAGLTIATDAGISGTGYTITVGHGGRVIQSAIDTLYAEDLVGLDPHDVRAIWQRLYFGKAHWIGRAGATTMAQSAVDIALWDILAKAAGQPLWQLLGGARTGDVPIYNTHAGWLNFSIDQLVDEARGLLDRGYTALKMKVGLPDTAEDCRRVRAVRECVGETVLMVDANQKWDLQQATLAAERLAEFGLSWLEEPLHPDDIPAHRALKERSTIPIALGEHVYTTHAFRDYMAVARGRRRAGRRLPRRWSHALARGRGARTRPRPACLPACGRPDAGAPAPGARDPERVVPRSDPDLGRRALPSPGTPEGWPVPGAVRPGRLHRAHAPGDGRVPHELTRTQVSA